MVCFFITCSTISASSSTSILCMNSQDSSWSFMEYLLKICILIILPKLLCDINQLLTIFFPSQWGNKMSITFQRFSMAKLESLTPFSQLRIETLSFGVGNVSSSLLEDCSRSTRVWGWLILRQLFHMSLLDFHNCSLFHHQLGTEQLVVQSLSWGVPRLVPTPLMANPPLSWPCRFSHNILPINEIWLHPFS